MYSIRYLSALKANLGVIKGSHIFLDSVGRDESRIPFMHSFTKELMSFVVPIGKNIILFGIFSASLSSMYKTDNF